MRLLLVNYEYPPIGAGAATATAEMARSAVRQGHEVTVLTAAFGGNAGWVSDQGVSVRRVASRRERADQSSVREMASFALHAALALPGVVRRSRADGCIVFFSLPCGPLGTLFRFITGKPYIVSLRGGDVPGTEPGLAGMHRKLRFARRIVLKRARAVVANSPGLATLSERADPVPVNMIPNGVDFERFRPATVPPRAPFHFLFVGRLNAQKNVGLLLEALARLAIATDAPFRASIVGDGPLRAELRTRATALGLDGRVEWIEWLARERMPALYQSAHCIVNPSHYEGMPNVVLEAMACGVPPIVSDVPGNRDVVEDALTGRVVAHDDLDALVAAMAAALRDPAALAALGTRAREAATQRYSWDATTSKFIDLLQAARGKR
jgi:glycosyltransferase involved in cell wall biosynthesis